MSTPPNIIELTRELQRLHDMWHGKISWSRPEQNIQAEHDFYDSIPEVFPSIVSALKIAVEALKEISNMDIVSTEHRESASLALSQIHTLPIK